MYTLFIDTHDELITVSLVNESNVFTKEQASFHKHAVYLVPMIRSILSENNLTVKDIIFKKIKIENRLYPII